MMRKPGRVLAGLLAVLMVLCAIPVTVSAASLNAGNVVEYPTTVEFVYFGQSPSDYLVDGGRTGRVELDGVQIPGHFEVDSYGMSENDYISMMTPDENGYPLDLIFVPDDSSYNSFSVPADWVNFKSAIVIKPTVLEWKQPTATPIKNTDTLASSVLSPAELTNPYWADDPYLTEIKWGWVSNSQNGSGIYQAQLTGGMAGYCYEPVVTDVYVEVEGAAIPETAITTAPVARLNGADSAVYAPGVKIGDLELVGGQVTVPGTGEVVTGHFEMDSYYAGLELTAGTQNIPVRFVLDNPDAYKQPADITVTFEVEKAEILVKTAPTVTLTVGQTLYSDGRNAFVGAVTEPAGAEFLWAGLNGETLNYTTRSYDAGEYTFDARVTAGSNYIAKMTPVRVVYLPITTPLQISLSIRDGVVSLRTNVTSQPGTLTWKANGEVIAEGVKGTETFEWTPSASGSYELTVEYVPGEGDVNYAYTMGRQTIEIVMPHAVTVTGGSGSGNYKPGDTVRVDFDQTTLKKNHEFKSWKITNAKGETIDVGAELTATSISFTMPDEAVNVEATSAFSIQLFFKNIGDSIMAFFMKIAEWFMGIFGGLGSLS